MTKHQDPRRGRPSASSAEQMKLCPASWLRQKGLPDRGGWEHLGNDGHAWLAASEDGREKIKLTPEAMETALECERLKDELAESLGFTSHAMELVEVRRWHGDLLSAQLDCDILEGDQRLLSDYKFGFHDVTPAEDNLQLRWQFLTVYAAQKDCFVAIIAPNSNPKVTLAHYKPAEDYFAALAEANRIIKAAEQPDAPAIPSEKACRYCRAAYAHRDDGSPVCEAHHRWATQLMPSAIRELPPMQVWTDDQWVSVIKACGAVSGFIQSVKAEAVRRKTADPDWNPLLKLRNNGSTRSVDAQALLASGKVAEWLLWQCATISVSKLENRLAGHCEWQKKEAPQKLAELLGDLLEVTEKAKSVEVAK